MDRFKCLQCGACCREPGYVCLEPEEAGLIAEYLGMDVYVFTERFTRLTRYRRELSLIERADGSCVFLSDEQTCRIEKVKPKQCRGFPLQWCFDGWEHICAGASERCET